MVSLCLELRPDSSVVAEVRPSPNHNERKGGPPDMILLHYTGMRGNEDAIRHLCAPMAEVSSHYVVVEDGFIVQLVAESRRAWHAGVSSWAGETDINSRSIGIEIANPGHDHGYPDFPKRQVAAVTALCRSILTRHQIPADRVLAHSYVAPAAQAGSRARSFRGRRLPMSGVGPLDQARAHRGRRGPFSRWAKPIRPVEEDAAPARTIRLWRHAQRISRRRDRDVGRGFPAPFPSAPDRRRHRRFDRVRP